MPRNSGKNIIIDISCSLLNFLVFVSNSSLKLLYFIANSSRSFPFISSCLFLSLAVIDCVTNLLGKRVNQKICYAFKNSGKTQLL